MKTKCLSLSRIQKFKIKLGRWELPNVKVHTNSDIIKQIFTFCEKKVFPRHKYNYPNSMKICRGKTMLLNETSNLIAQSRNIIESGQDDTTNSNALLNIILQTSIYTRVQRMETNIEKRIDELNQSMLSVSSRVRTLENRSNELTYIDYHVSALWFACSQRTKLFGFPIFYI
jgi:hypothetical protein